MKTSLPRLLPMRKTTGFSLVEVVLAIGIASFALLAILGVFGGILKTSDGNYERREMAEAVDSLRRTFQTSDFGTAYSWARGEQTLLYVTYRADPSDGTPDPTGSSVVGQWIDPDTTTTPVSDYDHARTGRWVRAQLAVAPNNPGGTTLPEDPTSWTGSMVQVIASLDILATPNPDAPTVSSAMKTNLALLR